MEELLQLLETVKGKFMLTMFPYGPIERYAEKNGWTIHRIERTISASKTSRRKQEEWMVCNYEEQRQQNLFEQVGGGRITAIFSHLKGVLMVIYIED